MTQEFRVVEQDRRHALEVAVEIPLWRIPKVLGEHFPRLKNHIESGDTECAGAPYARYLEIDWHSVKNDGFLAMLWQFLTHKQKMRVGMLVSSATAGDGDMLPVELPAGRYVQAIHRGAYHKVGETYKKIAAWADEHDVALADVTMENYVNDPTEVGTEDIETLILIPVTP